MGAKKPSPTEIQRSTTTSAPATTTKKKAGEENGRGEVSEGFHSLIIPLFLKGIYGVWVGAWDSKSPKSNYKNE
jgi:hypothetical protein|tara:strand:+ start:332 stop:553 length:222 start_codon:yes stop_codon:yes gene_type:complete